jgi:low molecular weight protein-tyrosine phosphatase
MKILMVCLGNICRSPLAEGILKEKIKENNLDWEVDSAGTGSWHIGEKPDERSIAVAKKYGIDISDQKARQLKPHDLHTFDYVFAMDSSNYRNIKTVAKSDEEREKVELIMNLVKPGYNQNVPDPYYNNNGFEEVYQMLDVACDKIVEQYKFVGKRK